MQQALIYPCPTQQKREIVLARVAGVCFGVRRAIDIALQTRNEKTGKITVLGHLVHNAHVLHTLKKQGIDTATDITDIKEGTVLLSAHGVSPQTVETLTQKSLPLVDVTCPFVTKVHRMARLLCEQGYPIVLVGDSGHTEVNGILGAIQHYGGTAWLVSTPEQVATLPLGKKVGVLSQTTQTSAVYGSIVAEVSRRVTDVRAINTICGATDELQSAARDLARSVDVVLVIGGKNSANTRRLRELCEQEGIPSYHIESENDIDPQWLKNKPRIGITAGASTPDCLIESVARWLNDGELPQNWSLHHPDE